MSKLFKLALIFLCIAATLPSCKNAPPSSSQDALNHLLTEELGEDYEVDFNDDKTFAIYFKKKDNNTVYPSVTYVIVNIKNQKMLRKDYVHMGSIKWVNNHSIEVLKIPGLIRDNESMDQYKEIINLSVQ